MLHWRRIILICFLSFTTFSYSFEKVKIVFYHIQAEEGIANTTLAEFERLLRDSLATSTKLETIDIENINKLFDDLHIPLNGCTRTECAIKVGQALQAKKSMYVTMGKKDEALAVSARIFDIESGTIDYSISPIYIINQETMQIGVNQLLKAIEDRIIIEPSILTLENNNRGGTVDCGGRHGIRDGDLFDIIKLLKVGVNVEEYVVGRAKALEVDEYQAKISITKAKSIHNVEVGQILRKNKGLDTDPPEMLHEEFHICTVDYPLEILLDVNDEKAGVQSVYIYYKTDLIKTYRRTLMVPSKGNTYVSEIPAEELHGTEFHYYFQATDNVGNTKAFRPFEGALDYFVAQILSEDKEPPKILTVSALERTGFCDVSVIANDDTKLDAVYFWYRFSPDTTFYSLKCQSYGEKSYGGEIEIPAVYKQSILEYFASAVDISSKKTQEGDKQNLKILLLGTTDVTPPVLSVNTAEWLDVQKIRLKATARDDRRMQKLVATIANAGQVISEFPLNNTGMDPSGNQIFEGEFTAGSTDIASIQYKITAFDVSDNESSSAVATLVNSFNINKLKSKQTWMNIARHQPNQFCFVANQQATMDYGQNVYYLITFVIDHNGTIGGLNLYFRNLGESEYRPVTIYARNKSYFAILMKGIAWGCEYYAEIVDYRGKITKIRSAVDPFQVIQPEQVKLSAVLQKEVKK